MPDAAEERRNQRKVREGTVVSTKMDKTVVVAVTDRVRHRRYGKTLARTTRLFAHDEASVSIGIEGVVAARPMSPSLEAMRGWLAALEQGLAREDRSVIFSVLRDAVPDFGGEAA